MSTDFPLLQSTDWVTTQSTSVTVNNKLQQIVNLSGQVSSLPFFKTNSFYKIYLPEGTIGFSIEYLNTNADRFGSPNMYVGLDSPFTLYRTPPVFILRTEADLVNLIVTDLAKYEYTVKPQKGFRFINGVSTEIPPTDFYHPLIGTNKPTPTTVGKYVYVKFDESVFDTLMSTAYGKSPSVNIQICGEVGNKTFTSWFKGGTSTDFTDDVPTPHVLAGSGVLSTTDISISTEPILVYTVPETSNGTINIDICNRISTTAGITVYVGSGSKPTDADIIRNKSPIPHEEYILDSKKLKINSMSLDVLCSPGQKIWIKAEPITNGTSTTDSTTNQSSTSIVSGLVPVVPSTNSNVGGQNIVYDLTIPTTPLPNFADVFKGLK